MYDKKVYGKVEVKVHSFLNSALDKGEWLVWCPNWVYPEERTPPPGKNGIEYWLVPGIGVYLLEKREISYICWESYNISQVVKFAAYSKSGSKISAALICG